MHKPPIAQIIDIIVADVVHNNTMEVKDVTRDVLADISVERLLAGASVRTRDMTRPERQARRERLNDDARRKRQERKKTERNEHNKVHAERAAKVDDATLREGLHIVAPTLRQLDRVVSHYGVKFSSVIGRAHLHEVATKTLDDLGAMVMVDDKHQPDIYRVACLYVATLPGVPDVPQGAPTGASRYAAMMKRRAWFNIIDWHEANPTLQSLEFLATVAANMYGSVDNLLARQGQFNRNPFPLPGKTDTLFLRCVVDSALEQMTVNGEPVGWLVDMLLDETKRDNVGRFDWVGNGREILTRLQMPVYPNLTPVLIGMYAMKATQKVMRFLPTIIREVIFICGDARLVARYFGRMPHHSRRDMVMRLPDRFEIGNDRKALIIPEHGTTDQLQDLYAELDTGLTKPQRDYKRSVDERAKGLVKIAAAIPTEFIVNEIEAVLRDLVDLERELV
jgi:hypothetical protein